MGGERTTVPPESGEWCEGWWALVTSGGRPGVDPDGCHLGNERGGGENKRKATRGRRQVRRECEQTHCLI